MIEKRSQLSVQSGTFWASPPPIFPSLSLRDGVSTVPVITVPEEEVRLACVAVTISSSSLLAWADAVGSDALLHIIHGDRLGEANHSCLGGAVRTAVCCSLHARSHRGHVYDVASGFRLQPLQGRQQHTQTKET